jgi:hypothetical protein
MITKNVEHLCLSIIFLLALALARHTEEHSQRGLILKGFQLSIHDCSAFLKWQDYSEAFLCCVNKESTFLFAELTQNDISLVLRSQGCWVKAKWSKLGISRNGKKSTKGNFLYKICMYYYFFASIPYVLFLFLGCRWRLLAVHAGTVAETVGPLAGRVSQIFAKRNFLFTGFKFAKFCFREKYRTWLPVSFRSCRFPIQCIEWA